MRFGVLFAALSLALLFQLLATAENKQAGEEQQARIQKLVADLASPRYPIRERARVALEKIGLPALDALRGAAKSDDMEVSETAQKLIKILQRRALTQRLLQPKMVNLKIEKLSVREAIDQLQKASGYQINVQGDRAVLNKKISLSTGGSVPFWQAFDMLCRTAGLTETTAVAKTRPTNPYSGIVPGRIRPFRQPIRQPNPANLKKLQNIIQQLQNQKVNPKKVTDELRKALELIRNQQQRTQKQLKRGGAKRKQRLQQKQKQLQDLQKQALEQLKRADVQRQLEKRKAAEKQIKQNLKRFENRRRSRLQQFGNGAGALQVQIRKRRPAKGQIAPAKNAKLQVQIAPAKVQVQILPAQQQAQIAIQDVYVPGRRSTGNANSNQITVRPGTPSAIPTFYAGALRIQVVAVVKNNNGVALTLRVKAEPRVQGLGLLGDVTVEKAVDNHGQSLDVVTSGNSGDPAIEQLNRRLILRNYPYQPNRSRQLQVTVRLKAGDKISDALKELKGKLATQIVTPPQTLVKIDNVMKAAGKTAQGKGDATLQLISIAKEAGNRYRLRVRVDAVNNPFGNNVFINGNVIIRGNVVLGGRRLTSNNQMPQLVDKNGKKLQLVSVPSSSLRGINGRISREMTMLFQAGAGQGEAHSLRLTGTSVETIDVPFQFRNVSLR